MGVNDLWQILEPVKQHAHLRSLQGKMLAVDLSLWVCEALTVKKMAGTVVKPHLRNLFFRISSLTLMGVKLLFVTEGTAPELKVGVMSKRSEMRYGLPQNLTHRTSRSCFRAVLKECLDMLECLGIPWVEAAGEAEAMCAYLDAHGYVDGCLTNDGDAFLYGAQTVYRNFTLSAKDPHVDCYTMSSIKSELGLDRDALIGLAVLLGCDYLPKGVPGVGKEQALKLIHALKGQSLLQRFDQWKEEPGHRDPPASTLKRPAHCSVCAHPGSPQDHAHRGCELCGSERYCEPHDYEYACPCAWHRAELSRQHSAIETSVKKKACSCEGFPFPEVIREFQISKDRLTKKIQGRRPNLLSFQMFALEKMEWPQHYACAKLMVLLTYHDMTERKFGRTVPDQLQPVRIVHPRTRSGVPCFEIQWQRPEHYVTAELQPGAPAVVTVEEASLFEAAYPDVVAVYQKQMLESQRKKPKSKKNKTSGEDWPELKEVADLLAQVELSQETALGQKSKCPPQIPPDGKRGQKTATEMNSQHFVGTPSSPRLGSGQQNVAGGPSPSTSAPQDDSAVVEALQLSSIDWEGTSFSASPGPQSHAMPAGDPGRLPGLAAPAAHDACGPRGPPSPLSLDLRPLKERVCAWAWEQPLPSSLQEQSQTQRAKAEASLLLRRKETLPVKSPSSSAPHHSDPSHALPGFRLQNDLEASDSGSRRPFFQEKPQASTCLPCVPSQVAFVPPNLEDKSQGKSTKGPTAPKRVPKKSVCLPCSSSDEENDPTGTAVKSVRPLGMLWPQQRPSARLSRPPRAPRADPREACEGAGAAGSPPHPTGGLAPLLRENDAGLVSDSPLPLAQRLKLKFQSF